MRESKSLCIAPFPSRRHFVYPVCPTRSRGQSFQVHRRTNSPRLAAVKDVPGCADTRWEALCATTEEGVPGEGEI